jgi:MYXO-CTERM domain-containing protein
VSSTASDDGSSRSRLRKAILALGILALAYAARRRARSSGAAASTARLWEKTPDRIREKASDVLPDGAERIPIGGTGGDESPGDATGTPTGTAQSDRRGPAATDRTLEEADERPEAATPQEPAASGEDTMEEDPTGGMGDYESDETDEETDHGIQ